MLDKILNTDRKTLDDVTVGFVISHPFHFYIYRSLIRAVPKPLVIIETRKNTPFTFSQEFLKDLGCEYLIMDSSRLKQIDQTVDVVFVMTPKHLSANFKHAQVILMQYGMAKEFYNYGLWRSRAVANFMYGPYSASICNNYAVTFPVGNTRFDGFEADQNGGGGLLYMPTYGDTSSIHAFVDALPKMPDTMRIKVKLHHASEFSDGSAVKILADDPRVTLLDGYTDVAQDIAAADIVLTDYSGSMFDAIYLQKPLVLFQPPITQQVQRLTDESIEIARGEELAHVLHTLEDLVAFIEKIAQGDYAAYPMKANSTEFFSNPGNAAPVACDLLEQIINGDVKRTVTQSSTYHTYTTLIARPHVVGFKEAVRKKVMRVMKKVLKS